MKRLFIFFGASLVMACGGSENKNTNSTEPSVKTAANDSGQTKTVNTTTSSYAPSSYANFTIDGKEIKVGASPLVSKDKKHLQPGANYLCMMTARSGPNNESLTLNFLMDTKPGTYPVVGLGFHRGPEGHGELYGGLLGGEEKLTNYKVNITECKDLGSNNLGGHKWSISGTFDDITIPAMPVMLMDKSKNHPKEITLQKGSFTNLVFDDNWEELMKQAVEKMKK